MIIYIFIQVYYIYIYIYQWDRFRMHEILKLNFFKQKFARHLRTIWGARKQKIRTQIEVLDRKVSRFRLGTVRGHTSTLRLLSLFLLTVGLALFAFVILVAVVVNGEASTSSGGCNKLSTDGLIVFLRCLVSTLWQTAQGNIIWAGVLVFDWQHDLSRCLGVWSTISEICKFRYCMHPDYISVT